MSHLPHAIALTGGIASGKSTAAAILRELGFAVICADKIAHAQLEVARAQVVAAFGDGILGPDGRIERAKLGAIVFASDAARARLEGILHPLIRAEIMRQAGILEGLLRPYFVDIPLFFETRAYGEITRSLLIFVPRNLQLERLRARNGLDLSAANARVNAQMPLSEKLTLASDVIDNSGDKAALKSALERYVAGLV